MAWIAGVDGSRGGWLAAFRHTETGEVTCALLSEFNGVLNGKIRPLLVAVDMPIGLADSGERLCDRRARELLGPRRASVFWTPIRPILAEASYDRANALSRQLCGKGVSRQAFSLVPKILEVEREVLGRPPGQIRECHPELCFMAMNGDVPLAFAKRKEEGLRQRRELLQKQYGTELASLERTLNDRPGARLDDLYNALATLWAAGRLARGEASRVPEQPPLDRLGIPMEITF